LARLLAEQDILNLNADMRIVEQRNGQSVGSQSAFVRADPAHELA
jgi:hypothetical protein